MPCAFCGLPGPETELQCFSCQNIIPFDIATGLWGSDALSTAAVAAPQPLASAGVVSGCLVPTPVHCMGAWAPHVHVRCLAAGMRMQVQDWAECGACKFACSTVPFINILRAERRCPMCNEEVQQGHGLA